MVKIDLEPIAIDVANSILDEWGLEITSVHIFNLEKFAKKLRESI